VLIVTSLISRSYIFDLAPGNSVVERLLAEGLDVYLLDWGIADELDAGNTLETYCDQMLPAAIRATADAAAASGISLFGYCFGGILTLLAVAGDQELPVNAVVTLATPVDFSSFGLLGSLAKGGRINPDGLIDHTGNVPPSVVHNAIRSLTPLSEVNALVNLWQHLDNDEYLVAHQRMTQWAGEHIPFAGSTFRQAVDLFGKQNLLVTGRLPLGTRTVDLANVCVPTLNVTAERDHIVPPESSDQLLRLVRAQPADELRLPGGHIGLIVGRASQKRNLPTVARWIRHNGGVA
jgi:polyhydroxyalkanoate synthase